MCSIIKAYKTLANGENADAETVDMILQGMADFAETSSLRFIRKPMPKAVISIMARSPRRLKMPTTSLSKAWQGISSEEYGGMNLPMSINLIKSEMIGTANWLGQCIRLSTGCINTMLQYGTDEQKDIYLPKLVEGTWSVTMVDRASVWHGFGSGQTKAVPQDDGTYKISGTKSLSAVSMT